MLYLKNNYYNREIRLCFPPVSTEGKFACLITGFSPINVSDCKTTH